MGYLQSALLSVIIPVYNTENYLRKCLDSIIRQTYKNLEIIIVDDGSTDDSGKICDECARLDKRVRVIHQENKGLLAARCIGAEKASGEYVTFVDSDDWIETEMYEKLMQVLKDRSVEVVACGMYRYWNEEKMNQDIPYMKEGIYEREYIEKSFIPVMLWDEKWGGQALDPSLGSKIFKRGLIQKYLRKAQHLEIYLGEDSSVIYPLMLEVNSLAIVRKCYYFHRQRSEDEIASYITDELFFERLFTLYTYLKKIFMDSRYAHILLKQLEYFYMRFVQLRRDCYVQMFETLDCNIFPYSEISEEADVVLYGAGDVGNAYKTQNDKYHFCNIVLWVDKRFQEIDKEGVVRSPEDIRKCEFDYIIIAVCMPELAKEIREELLQKGINPQKIIWTSTYIRRFLY